MLASCVVGAVSNPNKRCIETLKSSEPKREALSRTQTSVVLKHNNSTPPDNNSTRRTQTSVVLKLLISNISAPFLFLSNPNKRCIETHILFELFLFCKRRTQTSVVLKPKALGLDLCKTSVEPKQALY